MSPVVSHRKAQRYEQWPQQQRPMRSSDSPAATMIRGRSRMSRDSIILTSSKPSSQTSPASYLVGKCAHTHTKQDLCKSGLFESSVSLCSRFSCKRVLHQIKTTDFRVVTYLVSRHYSANHHLCSVCLSWRHLVYHVNV